MLMLIMRMYGILSLMLDFFICQSFQWKCFMKLCPVTLSNIVPTIHIYIYTPYLLEHILVSAKNHNKGKLAMFNICETV